MELGIGQHITRHLRLTRLLGQGGMGSVWAAEQLNLRTEVAVKVMNSALPANATQVKRFQNEAIAVARVKSPHIVQVFDVGFTHDCLPFIVMELLEGEDLARRIRRSGPLPLHLVATIIVQAAKGIEKAHAAGIVHRDIKPANLFLTANEGRIHVKLLDFGAAKHCAALALLTSTADIVGTPPFMSPEQLKDATNIDEQADFWSLAVTAYLSLSGELPFQAETIEGLLARMAARDFELPSAWAHRSLPALDDFFARAFAPNPQDRFSSVMEMANRLQQLATSTKESLPEGFEATPQPTRRGAVPRAIGGILRVVHGARRAILTLAFGGLAGAVVVYAKDISALLDRSAPQNKVLHTFSASFAPVLQRPEFIESLPPFIPAPPAPNPTSRVHQAERNSTKTRTPSKAPPTKRLEHDEDDLMPQGNGFGALYGHVR